MSKSHYREYAIDAFRFYAREGGVEKYQDKILAELEQRHEDLRCGLSDPTEAALINREKRLEEAVVEITELQAVEVTIETIERMWNGKGRMDALRMTYLAEPHREPIWGEMGERIHHASLMIPVSERTVKRWLDEACKIFAQERGLRMA